jgi:hypothetical protein
MTGSQPAGQPDREPRRPERTDEEWAAVFRDDLATSRAAERRLVWMELVALGVVAVLVALHFVWH